MFNKKTYSISIFIFIVFSVTVIFLNQENINGKVDYSKYKLFTLQKNVDLSFSGRVEAKRRKKYYTDNNHLIVNVNVKNGMYIKKGSPLFTYTEVREEGQNGEQISNEIERQYYTEYAPFSAYIILNQYHADELEIPFLQLYSREKIIKSNISEFDYYKIEKNMPVNIEPVNGSDAFDGVIQEIEEVPVDQRLSGEKTNDINKTISNYNFFVSANKNILYGTNVKLIFEQKYIKVPNEAFAGNDFKHIYLFDKGNVIVAEIKVKKEKNIYYTRDLKFAGKKIILNPKKTLKTDDEGHMYD